MHQCLKFILFRVTFYMFRTVGSNVRHPRCVLHNSKQLGMLTLTVEHNYICFITRSLQQRHVSALYVGHHQVVVRLTACAILACV